MTMPQTSRLKVFRTSVGFHDAYVAASSQKAALKAWGASKDLFGIGSAEVVTDPALTAEPLAHPGTVIKRLRGSAEEQLATAERQEAEHRRAARKAEKIKEGENERPPAPRRRKSEPPPSRKALDNAEAELATFEAEAEVERAELQRQEEAIRRQRKALADRQEAKADKLRKRVQAARKQYEEAMETWRQQAG
jgi:hypothetical protein